MKHYIHWLLAITMMLTTSVGIIAQQPKAQPATSHDIEDINLRNDLLTLGFIPEASAGDPLGSSVDAYAKYWGIERQRGDINGDKLRAQVLEHISNRGCMVPDNRAIEEANWPESCRDDLGLYLDFSNYNANIIGFSESRARSIFKRALDEWNSVIGVRLYISNDFPSAKTNVTWVRLSGSTLAWSHLANNSCRDDKQQRYDIRGWSEHQLYITVLHEVGHLLGLPHRRGNYVMNPSIITSLPTLTATDIRDAKRLGYKGPFPTTPTKPDPKPTTGITGSITLKDGTVISASHLKRIDLIIGTTNDNNDNNDDGSGVIVLPPRRRSTEHVHDGNCCGTVL